MNQYTSPVSMAFDVQRTTIEQTQRAIEQSLDFQRTVGQAVVDSLDGQESAQRRGVEVSRSILHDSLDAMESALPGSAGAMDAVRDTLDQQYDFLLENHAEAFETLTGESEQAMEAYETVSDDYLEALDEQMTLLLEAHESLQEQSIEAASEMGEQMDAVAKQVEEMQAQIESAQERAADAVDIDVEG